jgi:hypothetical protein
MELKDFIMGLTRGAKANIILLTVPDMSQKRRSDKAVNPYYGRLQKRTKVRMGITGVSYETCVDASLSRKGLEPVFESQKPSGTSWLEPNLILQSDKNPDQLYFRIITNKQTIIEREYLLDGEVVTDENVIDDIRNWDKGHSESAKQAAAGLEGKEQIGVLSPKFESVVHIEQGGKVWDKA